MEEEKCILLIKKNWSRKEIYAKFSKIDYHFYSDTIPIDVTNVKKISKDKELSFYFLMIWICTKAINSIQEFKIRIREENLVVLDKVNPSFTYLPKGADTFQIITVSWEDDYISFCKNAKKQSIIQKEFIDKSKETDELIYFSCTPWFDFTSLTNEHNFDAKDTIPRITWGKYYEDKNRLYVHMSIEVNHRTIDGFHIGQLKAAIDHEINTLI